MNVRSGILGLGGLDRTGSKDAVDTNPALTLQGTSSGILSLGRRHVLVDLNKEDCSPQNLNLGGTPLILSKRSSLPQSNLISWREVLPNFSRRKTELGKVDNGPYCPSQKTFLRSFKDQECLDSWWSPYLATADTSLGRPYECRIHHTNAKFLIQVQC